MTPPEPVLAGRVVAITGASEGIGEQFARAVSAAGAAVVLGARRVERIEGLARELGRAAAVHLEVTSEESRTPSSPPP